MGEFGGACLRPEGNARGNVTASEAENFCYLQLESHDLLLLAVGAKYFDQISLANVVFREKFLIKIC